MGMEGRQPPQQRAHFATKSRCLRAFLVPVFKPLAHLTFARGPALSKLSLRSGPSPDDLRASEYEETLLNLTL